MRVIANHPRSFRHCRRRSRFIFSGIVFLPFISMFMSSLTCNHIMQGTRTTKVFLSETSSCKCILQTRLIFREIKYNSQKIRHQRMWCTIIKSCILHGERWSHIQCGKLLMIACSTTIRHQRSEWVIKDDIHWSEDSKYMPLLFTCCCTGGRKLCEWWAVTSIDRRFQRTNGWD